MLAEGLREAIERAGHEVEIVRFPFKWYPAEVIPSQVLAARLLDLSEFSGTRIDRVIGLKFPAYLVPHPRKSLWLVHQHRSAYDFWESGHSDLLHMPQGRAVRDFIRDADDRFIPEAQSVLTISANVSERLLRFNHIASKPLYHPPLNADSYVEGRYDDYIFFPSRIDPMKRQWLVIDALAASTVPLKVIFAGSPDNAAMLEQLKVQAAKSGVAGRITWTGPISEREKIALYANACGVVYPPVDEDYGYVTLEAMLAGKPLVTCSDSGGPLEFVTDGINGLVAAPTPESLALALVRIWADRSFARSLGGAARASYERLGISWDRVVEVLLQGQDE
jgi:glycosyltransferase involved in cell wall biosynthesis